MPSCSAWLAGAHAARAAKPVIYMVQAMAVIQTDHVLAISCGCAATARQ